MPSVDFKIDELHIKFIAHLATFGTKQSTSYIEQANELIDQEKGTIETLHELFSSTIKSQIEDKKKSEALKNLKNLTQRQKEKEGILFKIFFSIFNSLSIYFPKKMQKYHDIESFVFPIEPVLSHKARTDKQTYDNRSTTSPKSSTDLMFDMDEKKEDEIKKEAKEILDTWRKTVKVKPEEKRENPNPKPEQIPIRRSKPTVLEETSPEKIRKGEGSIYDPIIAFKKMRV